MKKIVSIFFLILFTSIFSQEYLNKNEIYDLKVFRYLDSLTVTDKVSLNDYLKFSKPFSKWDIRPVNSDKIWSLDSIRTSSEISNFFWGGFSQNYELSQKAAGDKANQFINQGLIDEKSNVTFLNNNLSKFKEICSLLEKSKNLIFLNQNYLQRVDNIFKENEQYWSYLIPRKSPFPISTQIQIEEKYSFSSLNTKILKKMSEINIYSIVKTEKGIFLLIDGFTDNSYGFYFSKSNTIEKNNHLFEIMKFESIKNNFFYYIAN